MANETIEGAGDIYQKDLYGDIRKSGLSFIPVIDAINDGLKETAKLNTQIIEIDPKDIKSLKEVNKGIEDTNKAFESKIKLDNERVIIQQKINNQLKIESKSLEQLQADLDSLKKQRTSLNKAEKTGLVTAKEANKQRSELNVLIKVANKNLNEAQKEVIGLTAVNKKLDGEYDKQSKRLNALRKQYKNLVASEGKATKETKKLLKEINKLDKELKDIDESAGQFQRNVGNYPEVMGNAASAILGVAAAAVTAKGAFDGVKGSLEESAEGSENVREVTSALAGVWDQVSNVVAGAAIDVFEYGKAVTESVQSGKGLIESLKDTEGQFERTKEATTDFADKVKESIEGQVGLTDKIIEFEKSIRPLESRLVSLNGLIEEQQIIAGDSTRSFNELNEAVLKGQQFQIERAAINIKIAKEELSISNERVRIANLAGGAGVEVLNQQTDAVNNLKEAEIALKNELLENDKELRQIKQDRLEIDLDILIDGFDNQKTINERIISNEKETLSRRASLLDQTNKLADESFKGQKEILEDLSAEGIDVDDLLLLDATELAKQIQQLEQSEIINTRTLEVIRERKIVLQDLEDAQDALNESEQEAIDLRTDIIEQEKVLNTIIEGNAIATRKAIEELEKDREQNEIDSLRRRLDLAKAGSIEALNIQKELNDALISQQDERIEKEIEAEKKAAEDKKAIQQALLSKLEEGITKNSEKRLEEIDKQVAASEQQQDRLRDTADKGSLDAEKSIAEETKKQAELQKRRHEEERKQELITSGFKVFSALLESGKSPGEALLETGVILQALPEIIEAIPAFFDGSENIGTTENPLDSNGGRLVMAHDNERIMTEKQNNKMGGISNDDAANVIEKYNNGLFSDLYDFNQPIVGDGIVNSINLNGLNKGVERMLGEVNKSVKAIQIPETTWKKDQVRGLLTLTTRTGNKIVKEHSKLH